MYTPSSETSRAIPKSATLATSPLPTKIFLAARSLWTHFSRKYYQLARMVNWVTTISAYTSIYRDSLYSRGTNTVEAIEEFPNIQSETSASTHEYSGTQLKTPYTRKNKVVTAKPSKPSAAFTILSQKPIVFKSTRLPRLHDTRNRIVLKTLHFGQRFQKYTVTHRFRVNGRCNRIQNDTITNETALV